MYEHDKREIIRAALENYGLIALSGGNVSVRKENGDVVVTPSGTAYETMREDDLIVFNAKGERIEGTLRESAGCGLVAPVYLRSTAGSQRDYPYASAIRDGGRPHWGCVSRGADHARKRDARRDQCRTYCSAASLDMGDGR